MTFFQQIKLISVLGAALLCLGCGSKKPTPLYAYDLTPLQGMRDTLYTTANRVYCSKGFITIYNYPDINDTVWYGVGTLNGRWEVLDAQPNR